jgi:hypothetical protein
MSRIKYAVDSKHTEPWILRIGKMVVNFSALEMESVLWLVQLAEEPSRGPEFAAIPYKARVSTLRELAKARSMGSSWERRMGKAWERTVALASLRNHVAHNPVMFAWSSGIESGTPDLLGVPNIRGAGKRKKKGLLSLHEADAAINEVACLAQELANFRQEWCVARDHGNVAPVGRQSASVGSLPGRIARYLQSLMRKVANGA